MKLRMMQRFTVSLFILIFVISWSFVYSGIETKAGIPLPAKMPINTKITANAENTAIGETADKAFDGDTATKWLAFQPSMSVTFSVESPLAAMSYSIVSANDLADRDPKDWTLEGSNDRQNWTLLDKQQNQMFNGRFQLKAYSFENKISYKHYKLTVTKNNGSRQYTQLAEFIIDDARIATDGN